MLSDLPLLSTTATVFLFALIGSLLPLLNSQHALLRYANSFSAGFLSSAALVHLIPSSHARLHKAFPIYPVDGLLVLTSAILVFLAQSTLSTSKNPATIFSSSLVLPFTLCFHSLLEGLTLGISILEMRAFVAVAVAIIAHKFFAALTLSTSLLTHPSRRVAMAIAVFFSCLTPIGILIGALAVHLLPTSDTLPAICSCLTAGVFLYMAFVELLPSEFGHGHSHGVQFEDQLPLQLWEYSEIDAASHPVHDVAKRKFVFVLSAAAMSFLAFFV